MSDTLTVQLDDVTLSALDQLAQKTERSRTSLVSQAVRDYVALKYHALGANAVLKPERAKPIRLEVEQDGKPVARADRGEDLRYDSAGHRYVLVDQPRMYRLVKNAKFGTRELKLLAADEGLGLYSFTFTSCTTGA